MISPPEYIVQFTYCRLSALNILGLFIAPLMCSCMTLAIQCARDMAMIDEMLVYSAAVDLDGASYQVSVFCRADGRHSAHTPLGADDIIINDGFSLEEVLEKHQRLLPLAISSRRLTRKFQGILPRPRIRS